MTGGRQVRKFAIVAAVVVVALLGGLLAWQALGDDGDEGGRDLLITAQVEQQTLRDAVTVRGVVERSEVRTVYASTDGRVNQVVAEDGATVAAGDTILAIEGRPSVAVNGDLPFYRALDVGSEGPDVRQLETILRDAGYDPGPVDVLYTEQTRAALAGWQAERGYPGTAPETAETLTVTLTPGSGYTVGELASAAVTIGPGSAAPLGLRAPGAPVTARAQALPVARLVTGPFTAFEGADYDLTVTLEPAPATDVAVALFATGTAAPGLDVGALPASVVVPAGTTSVTFPLQVLDDDVVEPAETLSIALLPGAGYAVGSPSATVVTVAASFGDPVLTVRADTAVAAEGAPAGFTVLASSAPGGDLDIAVAYLGTATDGTDYVRPAGTITLGADATQVAVPVSIRQDAVVEPDETVQLVLLPGFGYQVGQPDRATTTIVSDDAPELTLSGGGSVGEGAVRTLTVTADTPPARDVLVTLNAGGTATPVTDYDPLPASVLLPAGRTSVTVPVQSLADDLVERPETVVVTLAPAAGGAYRLGPVASQTVTIDGSLGTDLPAVAVQADAAIGGEGRPATFTVFSDRRVDDELDILVTLRGSATPGVDVDPPFGRIVLAPGQRSTQVSVNVRQDDLVEPDETVELILVASPDYRLAPGRSATTLVEDDDVPELSLVGGGVVAEGGSGGLTVRADRAPAEDTSVSYQAVGTAQVGVDIAPVTGTVVLRAGATSVGVPILALDDDVVFQPTDMIVGSWPSRIGTVLVEEGQAVAPGAPLFTITEPEFTITLQANATDRSELVIGQEVDVTIEAGGQETTGVIVALDDVATVDPASGAEQYEGTVEITDQVTAVDGAAVTLEVVLDERPEAIVVPIAAVSQSADGTDEVRVIDLESGEFRRVAVETGLQEGAYIEILSGLEGDEIVVVEVDEA